MTDQEGRPTPPERDFVGSKAFWQLVGGVIVAALLVVFALQNTHHVVVEFLGWSWDWQLIVVIAGSAASGALLGRLGAAALRRRRDRKK